MLIDKFHVSELQIEMNVCVPCSFLALLKQTVVKKVSLNGDSKPDLLDV